jgi:bifunctional DNA-binding transcriptional regulator/antitoxin component of YhaV-PrlF toxin-antitoxin module
MKQFIHKISGVDYKTSVHVVIPHHIVDELGIARGDFVQIDKKDNQIVIKKLLAERESKSRIKNTNFTSEGKRSLDNITSRSSSREGSIDTGISTGPDFR